MEPIYDGYTAPEVKHCIRCLGLNDNPLQQLCDTCRRGDELAAWILELAEEQKLQKDHDLEVSSAREGF
jgi:hypothetical protein